MGSKGARYIVLPLYVVYIGLLYSLLLTSGLILAWCTIYRHEESIVELKEILNNKQSEENLHLNGMGRRGDEGLLEPDVTSELQKLPLVTADSSQRSRRHLNSRQDAKNAGSHQHLKGEKGEKGQKGDEGRKGRRGKKGLSGTKGSQGEKGERGETGKDGRDGRDGVSRPGQPGNKGDKGDAGDQGPRGYRGFPGPEGPPGIPGPKGQQGSDGVTGPKGEAGQKGDKGEMGNMGKTGMKGDKGEHGIPGIKGSKGDRGLDGQTMMFSESAHIVGSGGKVKSTPGTKMVHPTVAWKPKHLSGSMTYKGGFLRVGVDGFYFIYSQMFYYDGTSAHMGYNVYIDDRKVLKTVYSVPSSTKKYHTQYTSGIFKIAKGQKISVGTPFTKYYYFNESSSFFGAFMVHR